MATNIKVAVISSVFIAFHRHPPASEGKVIWDYA